jgi:phage gp36-like protein
MSYITRQDMIDKYGEREIIEITNQGKGLAIEIDFVKLDKAIASASSQADGLLAGRYPMPLQKVPEYLVDILCDIAHYRCSVGTNLTKDSKERYEQAVKDLKDIAKGGAALGGSVAGESSPTPTSSNNVMWSVGRRDFGRGY